MTENAFAVAAGSCGEILFDPTTGFVVGFGWQQGSHPNGSYDDILCLDVSEWTRFYYSPLLAGDWIDILDIGFWLAHPDGFVSYEFARRSCRNAINMVGVIRA